MVTREYRSPEAFRMALEQRIRSTVPGAEMNRFRQLLVFDRFLARVFAHFGEKVVLKGGLVLELRLQRARTTHDVDLRLVGDNHDVLDALRAAGAMPLGDWLSFAIQPDADMPRIVGDGMIYEGRRFRAETKLAGKPYGGPFGVDVGFADVLTNEPDVTEGSRFLEFVGIEPPSFRIYPRPAHVAEKLHAYTLPRKSINTRIKDLPDLALLASIGSLDGSDMRRAIEATFAFRSTHPVPVLVPPPPAEWSAPYERMATADALPWKTLSAVHHAAESFLNPLLQKDVSTWDPIGWRWG